MVNGDCKVPWQKCFTELLLVAILVSLLTEFSSSEKDTIISEEVFARIGGARSVQSGLVEISFDGNKWVKVYIDKEWEVSHVVCRQLGFGPPSYAIAIFVVDKEQGVFVSCHGDEMTLSDCSIKANYSHHTSMVLTVSCLPVSSTEFDIVMVKRYSFLDSGIVLTFVDGHWGPICSSSLPTESVCNVICKQLGYRRCEDYLSFTSFQADIFEMPVLGELDCSKGAKSLKDCSYRRPENQTCSYPENKLLFLPCTMYYKYGAYDDNYELSEVQYQLPEYDESSDKLTPIIALGVTASLCIVIMVLWHQYRKCSLENTTSTLGQGQERSARSLLSASTRPPSNPSAAATGTETDGLFPRQDYQVYPPQSGISFDHPLPPPAYTSTEQVDASPSLDMPSLQDSDLPTYEEAVANKPYTQEL